MLLGRVEQRLQPVRGGEGIRVQEGDELAVVEHVDPDVVGGGEADVLLQAQQRDLRIRRVDQFRRAVRARVVDHENPVGRSRLAESRADRAEQQLADVEAHDDDTDPMRPDHRSVILRFQPGPNKSR